jgi:glycosyltransferase involved in cell wall biosynthesis
MSVLSVRIASPTYGRPQFLPFLLKFFHWQNYPQDKIDLLILDDSQVPAHALFEGETRVRYMHMTERLDTGAKRNRLNRMAEGDIVICFDDDGYYGAERVRLAVNALTQSGAEFGGTADVLYYFPRLDRFVRFNNKICASSMFYTRDYARSHACLEGRRNGAEASFRNAKHVAVLANDNTCIAIGHGSNTVSKRLVAQLPAQPYNAAELFPPDYLGFLKTI